MKRQIALFALCAAAAGCAVNPVTGKREITLVSEAGEIQLGEQNYQPMQQSQGGIYDIDQDLTEYVDGIGQRLAAVSDRPLPYEFVVLNNSVPNAWALPGGKIAINRGLLTELGSEAELAAVLGHEIVHAAARHSARQMERGMLLQGLVLATAVATSDTDYQGLAMGGAGVGAQLINQAYGRGAELESDKYGMRYMARAGYDPQGAVSLQETFVRLSEGRRTDWLSGLFASHPPSVARVTANQRTAQQLGAGGELGVDAFKVAMAKTRRIKPAYDAYDEGRKALAEKDTAKAVRQAEIAIGLFPDEANFYALRGDARLIDKRYDMAVTNYSSALRRRDDFFYYHLQRGLAYAELNNDAEARVDLERSMALLPTAPARYALGNIAARSGDTAGAIEHYRAVAGGQGEMATAARGDLAKLDMADNPQEYILRRCDADSSGNLVVSVKNDTNLLVGGVRIAIDYTDSDGRARRMERRVRRLRAEEIASVQTELGPFIPGSACPATVIAARVIN
ncbi:MAG: M48 family metalloprotease [Pseudomonadota bacterium]